MHTATPNELTPLAELSARLGRDPLLTQASAGSTSMKIQGRLWIKASGKRLADALHDDIFLPVELSKIRDCVRQQRSIKAPPRNSSEEELRPCPEIAMHAVLPHRVIVHVHSLNTLARAVRLDAQQHLESVLEGLSWAWIPYALSGAALAQYIESVVGCSPGIDILVLGNHGLVVCGDSCKDVEYLLKQVEMRLGAIPRRAPKFDSNFLGRLAERSKWRLPEHTRLHCLGTDEHSRRILEKGSLYPSQLLYLGGPQPWQPFYSGLYSEAVKSPGQPLPTRRFLIVEDKGVLLSNTISRIELETLVGLAEVVQRLDVNAPIRYLTPTECEQIKTENVPGPRATLDYFALSA